MNDNSENSGFAIRHTAQLQQAYKKLHRLRGNRSDWEEMWKLMQFIRAHEATLANRLKIEVVQENKVFMDAISTLEINDGSPSKLQRNASGEYQELKRQEVNMIII